MVRSQLFRAAGPRQPQRRNFLSISVALVVIFSLLPLLFASSSASLRHGVFSAVPYPKQWDSLRGGSSISQDIDNLESQHLSQILTKTDYRTVQVQIVHRHGDRTPITPLRDESYWVSTLVPPEMLQKVAQGTKVLHHETSDDNQPSQQKHAAQGRGPFGKLTRMGLLQMIDVGSRLKQELEENTLWSNMVSSVDERSGKMQLTPSGIKIYSTDFDRTIQSVQGVLVGFFPDGISDPIIIDCRHTTSWMIPDPQPRRTQEQLSLEMELAQRPHMLEREAEMRPLAIRCTQSLQTLLGEDAFQVSYGVGEEGDDERKDNTGSSAHRTLSWAQLSEITKCLYVHNMLPDSITKEDQEATSAYCAWKWFESLRHPRLAYLSMNQFTHTIVQGMKDHASVPPLIIYSCHDSSLIGLLCAFHLEQPSVWPEYGSVLKLELLEKTETKHNGDVSTDLVVRFYLNSELLRSMWHGNLREEIPLKKLAHYISTVGAVKVSYL